MDFSFINRIKELPLKKKILLGLSIFILIPFLFLILLRLLVSFEVIDSLPTKAELRQIKNPIGSEIFADNGKLIGKYYLENRGKLRFEDLNDHYKNALIATEDVRFYKHNGVDNRSLLRVVFKSILLFNKSSGGGSTITQQLAKNLYPRKRYKLFSTLINKFREFSIARKIEKVYSKEEILLLYSNTVSFGERAFGLHTASKRFFNKSSGGGSTITQQLAKNLYPRKRYKLFSTLINKFREFSIARKIEKVYSKEEILLLYSNTVSFGERAFGLHTASKRFFNKEPIELKLEEAALLVGILKATTYYNPRRYPKRAEQRRNLVLSQMVKYDFLAKEKANELEAIPVELDYQALSTEQEFGRYFKEKVRKDFEQWSKSNTKAEGGHYNLKTEGLKIYTTLDYEMQIAAESYMKKHMVSLQKIFLDSWEGGKMFGSNTKIIDDQILAHPTYKAIREQGKKGKEALTQFNTKKKRIFWSWEDYIEKETTRIDSIKHYLSLLHTGVLAADPRNGDIKVWIGGNDYGEFQWDNITAPRQIGSVFKPIVYLAALENGMEPCDYYKNEVRIYSSYKDWTPRNADESYGGYLPVWRALSQSVNTVSVQVLFEIDLPKVVKTASELGIESPLSQVPSIVLGTSDISLYEMVRTYSVLAAEGQKTELGTITKIEDSEGNILFEKDYEILADTSTISKESIQKLNSMLSKVTTEGTGRRLQSFNLPFEVMGKTGTTQNQSDGWFVGYNDQLVVGAWVGTQDRRIHFRNLGTGSGGRTALPLVGAVFDHAAKNGMRNTPKDSIDLNIKEFDCPAILSDEQYAYVQSQMKRNDIESVPEFFRLRKEQLERKKQRPNIFEDIKRELDKEKRPKRRRKTKKKSEWQKRLERIFGKRKN